LNIDPDGCETFLQVASDAELAEEVAEGLDTYAPVCFSILRHRCETVTRDEIAERKT
jgi:hypothetical protein